MADIAADPDNRVVVITGTGESFIAAEGVGEVQMTADLWAQDYLMGRKLVTNYLDIQVPVIAAVNGPAPVHSDLAVLADIVVASDRAAFQDKVHYVNGLIPGDGVQVTWSMLLGPLRARYFLLTGQGLSAAGSSPATNVGASPT